MPFGIRTLERCLNRTKEVDLSTFQISQVLNFFWFCHAHSQVQVITYFNYLQPTVKAVASQRCSKWPNVCPAPSKTGTMVYFFADNGLSGTRVLVDKHGRNWCDAGMNRKVKKGEVKTFEQDFSTGGLGSAWVATEWFSGGNEQRLPLISSAVILQNPRATILIISQSKGARNHQRLRSNACYCVIHGACNLLHPTSKHVFNVQGGTVAHHGYGPGPLWVAAKQGGVTNDPISRTTARRCMGTYLLIENNAIVVNEDVSYFVKGGNIDWLDVLFIFRDFLFQKICRHLKNNMLCCWWKTHIAGSCISSGWCRRLWQRWQIKCDPMWQVLWGPSTVGWLGQSRKFGLAFNSEFVGQASCSIITIVFGFQWTKSFWTQSQKLLDVGTRAQKCTVDA